MQIHATRLGPHLHGIMVEEGDDTTVKAPPPAASQATSHLPLEPITADVLFDREAGRRDGLLAKGKLLTGCREIDDEVLLGGFERGSVVGVSAEEEEIALLVSEVSATASSVQGAKMRLQSYLGSTRERRHADDGAGQMIDCASDCGSHARPRTHFL
jgi:hypothetical protein